MSQPGKELFREKSLERLSSPERLDQLLQVVDRRSWIPLGTMALLVALIVGWSIFGKIPVYVEGRGVLIRPRGVLELQAPAAGYVERIHVRLDQRVAAGELLAVIAQPELEKRLELARARAAELVELNREMLRFQFEGETPSPSAANPADLAAYRKLALGLREQSREAIVAERRRLEAQLEVARAMTASHKRQWERQKVLLDDGTIIAAELLPTEQDYTDSLAREAQIEGQLQDLQMRALEIEESYVQRMQRISDREQEMAEARREIVRLEAQLNKESRIVSECAGQIRELNAAAGEYLDAGARLGLISVEGQADGFVSVSYFLVRDGKRLREGKRILVSPDTVERERYGSIRGEIDSVSDFPVTLEQVEAVVGTRELAEGLAAGGYLIEVQASLELNESHELEWTSGDGPELTVSAGTTTRARVPIEDRPPITFVLPFLRTAFGVD